MKLYDAKLFPNPRRVRIFLAEKNLDVLTEQVDILAGHNRTPAYLEKNPYGLVPTLQTDEGDYLGESAAICRYIEEKHPEPNLMGRDPTQKATIDMWHRRVEGQLLDALAAYFLNTSPEMRDGRYQNAQWGEHRRDVAVDELRRLDRHLAQRAFIAADRFSIADIVALCAVDFAQGLGVARREHYPHLAAWYANVSARPSAAA